MNGYEVQVHYKKKTIEVINSNNHLVIIAIMAFQEDKTIY